MATPNRQICAQMMAHLTALRAIHTRRSDHKDGAFRFTLRNRPWPGTMRAEPPICAA